MKEYYDLSSLGPIKSRDSKRPVLKNYCPMTSTDKINTTFKNPVNWLLLPITKEQLNFNFTDDHASPESL